MERLNINLIWLFLCYTFFCLINQEVMIVFRKVIAISLIMCLSMIIYGYCEYNKQINESAKKWEMLGAYLRKEMEKQKHGKIK